MKRDPMVHYVNKSWQMRRSSANAFGLLCLRENGADTTDCRYRQP